MNFNDNNLGFLLADVSRLMRRTFQKRLENSALTFIQARVLMHLSRQEGLRQIDLAELLEMQPISLARMIDQLETSGLVERRADPSDRRAYRLFLLPAAAPHVEAIKKVASSIRSDVFRNLSEEEADMAYLALSKMRENLVAQ